jgi:hypothetical protein
MGYKAPEIANFRGPIEEDKSMESKKHLRHAALLVLIAALSVAAYPLRNGRSLRDATADEIVQQVPYSLDILAARHPVKVGLLRNLLNDDGSVDRFAQDYLRTSMNAKNLGVFDCYAIYYVVVLYPDAFRQQLANHLEKDLGLS